MASADTSLSAGQFSCSICLEIFTDPVSTPCGHNYCKSCIKAYWATSALNQCPLCKETFHGVPELRVNTEFRDMLEVFLRTVVACEDSGPPAEPGKVPCDICHGVKREALKSCLVCLASYCYTHLEPHHTVQALKWHKLIDPVANLQGRVCRKHNKILEFFCRNDRSCVCIVCLRDDHVMHEVISLEEEAKERKTKVKDLKRHVDHTVSEKSTMAKEIQSTMMHGSQKMERMKAETIKAFTSLVAMIETKKTKLIELLEEKQKAAEKTDEAFLRQLQMEVFNNEQTSAKLEELSKTEDNFRLLQDLPSIPPSTNTDFRAQRQLDLQKVRRALAKMKDTLTDEMDSIIREVTLAETDETQTQKVFNDELGKIQRNHAVNVTLDPNTAHPSLIISEDRKQVRDGGMKRKVPDTPTRFDFFHFVFGNEGLSSGRFYYEVLVTGQTCWEVGVARESISKKGVDLSLSPENGCWTLGSYWGCWQANTNPPIRLSLPKKPKKVGVFVDYDGELVSFYNVDTRMVLYSFTGCTFTASEPNLNEVTKLKGYTGTTAKSRIYPLFRPGCEKGSDSAPLQITPV